MSTRCSQESSWPFGPTVTTDVYRDLCHCYAYASANGTSISIMENEGEVVQFDRIIVFVLVLDYKRVV
jgi:hypothetical protein